MPETDFEKCARYLFKGKNGTLVSRTREIGGWRLPNGHFVSDSENTAEIALDPETEQPIKM